MILDAVTVLANSLVRNFVLDCRLAAILVVGEMQATEAVRFEPYRYDYQGQHIQAELGRFVVPER